MKKGFTIVEIVIVVIVIGILAGITVLGYGSWRERTAVTTVKNDLIAADVVMKGAQDRETGFPLALPSSFESSDGVTLIVKPGGNATFYCFEATTTGKPGVTFFMDSDKNREPKEGTCTMPYSPPATPPVVASYTGAYGLAINPTNDYIYYSTSIGGPGTIRRMPLGGGTPENVMTSPGTGAVSALLFDPTGNLYVANGPTVYKVNLSTLATQTVVSGLYETQSLYLDGSDTLYIGGSRDLYRYTFSTSTLTSLYYSGGNPTFKGIAKVGGQLYLTRSFNKLSRYDLATSQMTIDYASSPLSTGSHGNIAEMNGTLYAIMGPHIYSFNTSNSTWAILKSDIKPSNCVLPITMATKYGYVFYIGRADSAQTSCAAPVGGFALQTIRP